MWDFLEEFRPLSDIENNGRDILKQHLDKILEFQRIYWKQRATIRWVKLEDENSNFYKTKATLNRRHNSIASLTDSNGNIVSDQDGKAHILWQAFRDRLGKSNTTEDHMNFQHILKKVDNLNILEAPFSCKEIDEVVKQMPSDKAPGPDGFNGAFIKHCWDIICQDFYRLIADIHAGVVNLQSINAPSSH